MSKRKITAFVLLFVLSLSLVSCDLLEDGSSRDKDEKINIETATDASASADVSSIWEDEGVRDKIDTIDAIIDDYYYFNIDREKQEEALYDAIMEGLDDPYSVYYTPEEFAELQEDTSGEYVGIGAVVTQDADMVVSVVRPIPGSPAEESGLQAEDIITEVDGTEIVDQELTLVVDMIRGTEGTKAHIKLYRPSIQDYIEVDVERRVVENVSVYSEMLDNNIGYIQVQQFYENTSDEFKTAIDALEAQGMQGIIIDMRDNPGGVLTTVVDMCDYLMDGGVIVTTKDKNGNIISEYSASEDHSIDIPMVVLTNGNSASASEIFSGAMQDTGMAELVGTTTYGKGIVQSVIPLDDGSAIKLTVAKYFTPNGNDIHEKGIVPDYEVELPDGRTNAVNLDRAEDTQLQKAEEVIAEMLQ